MLLVGFVCVIAFVAALPLAGASAQTAPCSAVLRTMAGVHRSKNVVSWRAGIEARTALFYRLPVARRNISRWIGPADASWLLVIGPPHAADGRCWLRVRLPWRPNGAAAWVNRDRVLLQPTRWRIDVSRARRTLTLLRFGVAVRTVQVVVGKPSTPTPVGLFAILEAVPWHPHDFLGSWVLLLTAHSDVLQEFDGGDGTVAIHGRGGASLADPLGSALSHGCIRLANGSIDWLVHEIGVGQLPGTPVQVS